MRIARFSSWIFSIAASSAAAGVSMHMQNVAFAPGQPRSSWRPIPCPHGQSASPMIAFSETIASSMNRLPR